MAMRIAFPQKVRPKARPQAFVRRTKSARHFGGVGDAYRMAKSLAAYAMRRLGRRRVLAVWEKYPGRSSRDQQARFQLWTGNMGERKHMEALERAYRAAGFDTSTDEGMAKGYRVLEDVIEFGWLDEAIDNLLDK